MGNWVALQIATHLPIHYVHNPLGSRRHQRAVRYRQEGYAPGVRLVEQV